MTDEKNHANVTEVLEKGINRKVVVVMEQENQTNVVELLEKRNKRNAVVKKRTIRPVCTASDTSCFFRCEFKSLSKTSSDFKAISRQLSFTMAMELFSFDCREIEKHFWSKFSVKCAPCEVKYVFRDTRTTEVVRCTPLISAL